VTRVSFGQSLALAPLVALGVGCGGAVASSADGGGADDSATDGTLPPIDGSSTTCVAPSGDSVCGGPNHCASSGPTCSECAMANLLRGPDDLSVCAPQFSPQFIGCDDGEVMIAIPATSALPNGTLFCAPFDYGALYAANGWSKAVRYADYDLYNGAPLPTPASCPSVRGLTLCGAPADSPVTRTASARRRRAPRLRMAGSVAPGTRGASCSTSIQPHFRWRKRTPTVSRRQIAKRPPRTSRVEERVLSRPPLTRAASEPASLEHPARPLDDGRRDSHPAPACLRRRCHSRGGCH
jgi:hypothetical protein